MYSFPRLESVHCSCSPVLIVTFWYTVLYVKWVTNKDILNSKEFIFLGSQITADAHCRHDIKILLLLGRKTMTNLESLLKSKYITLLTKVHSQSYGFSSCESRIIKKLQCWRTDAFGLRCWSKLLRVPWTVRRSSQSLLKEISLEYSLEGLMLKLKLQ